MGHLNISKCCGLEVVWGELRCAVRGLEEGELLLLLLVVLLLLLICITLLLLPHIKLTGDERGVTCGCESWHEEVVEHGSILQVVMEIC